VLRLVLLSGLTHRGRPSAMAGSSSICGIPYAASRQPRTARSTGRNRGYGEIFHPAPNRRGHVLQRTPGGDRGLMIIRDRHRSSTTVGTSSNRPVERDGSVPHACGVPHQRQRATNDSGVSAGSAPVGRDAVNTGRYQSQRLCRSDDLPVVVPPGTTKRWVNHPPAQTPRELVIHGGFVVDGGRTRHLQRRARALGFTDLRGYLEAGSDASQSAPQLATELGVSERTVKQALTWAGVQLPPRAERLARQRRHATQQRLAAGRASSASPMCRRTWPIGCWCGRGRWPRSPPNSAPTGSRCGGSWTTTAYGAPAGPQGRWPLGSGAGGRKRPPGRRAAPTGWLSWALRTWPPTYSTAWCSSAGRSGGCGRSFGSAVAG
jgi:hypothetical protein